MTDEETTRLSQRDAEILQSYIRPIFRRTSRAYNQMLTSLWLGNAGASLATLTFIGGALQKGAFPRFLLVPLWFFVSGLIFMGIGAGIALIREAMALDRMQRVSSIWEIKVDDIRSPLQGAGLALDWRSGMAAVSALCFICGCAAGLIGLTF
jgi:hypothetical protein